MRTNKIKRRMRKESIKELLMDGKTYKEITDSLKCSNSLVKKAIDELDDEINKKNKKMEQIAISNAD